MDPMEPSTVSELAATCFLHIKTTITLGLPPSRMAILKCDIYAQDSSLILVAKPLCVMTDFVAFSALSADVSWQRTLRRTPAVFL